MKSRISSPAAISAMTMCGLVLLVGGQPVQKPFGTHESHEPKSVMGRQYWTMLSNWYYSDPGFSQFGVMPSPFWDKSPFSIPAMTNAAVFRDCGITLGSGRLAPDSAGTKATWRTVKENFHPYLWKSQERNAKPDKPRILYFASKRHESVLAGEVDLDMEDWKAFKASYPNILFTRTLSEWGNDMLLFRNWMGRIKNPQRRAELEARFARYDMDDRYDRLDLARWYLDRMLELNYGDKDMFSALRCAHSLDHVAAAYGAKMLAMETTNSTSGDSEYRWDVAGMFVRGAARQFGVPWLWYEASFFNGPAKDGSWHNNSVCSEIPPERPRKNYHQTREGGTSASAQRRVWYYAYLNGANFVQSESWVRQFFTTNTPSGKAALSVRGRNFSDFHDFTVAHGDRGVPYAPVAILTPFAQGYTAYGGRAWGRCPYTPGDYAIDSLFFTIAPGWEREKGLLAGIQEGNLHNSRFAMMYDVLVPDSPQKEEDFAKALSAYPVAILAGDYRDTSKFEDVLAAYEKAGGRLIRLTADGLPPINDGTVGEIKAGRLRFPSVERILEGLQRDLFPFAVTGDCQYGANKTKDGWWLWVFNNKGVRKYADTFETIDRTKDSTVSVEFVHARPAPVRELITGADVKVSGGRFTYKVAAGDLAVFKIGPPGR